MSLQERELRDPRVMRALAHPLRLKLLELATREGTLTSTRAAELTGESTGSCSFHLRQLAKYGFLEEADGRRGRERPWRPVHHDLRWSDVQPDDETAAAAGALTEALLERDLDSLFRYVRGRAAEPEAWREAMVMSTSHLYLTADELDQFGRDYLALLQRHLDRTADPSVRPPGSRAVRALAVAFPLP
jgi:hypothetical protein